MRHLRQIPGIAAALFVTLAGLGTAVAGTRGGEGGSQAEEEQLCGAATYPGSFAIEVVSTGCTEADDFVFVIERAGESEFDLQVIRIVSDPCDGFERTIRLEFDRQSLGLDGDDVINLRNSLRGECPARW